MSKSLLLDLFASIWDRDTIKREVRLKAEDDVQQVIRRFAEFAKLLAKVIKREDLDLHVADNIPASAPVPRSNDPLLLPI